MKRRLLTIAICRVVFMVLVLLVVVGYAVGSPSFGTTCP